MLFKSQQNNKSNNKIRGLQMQTRFMYSYTFTQSIFVQINRSQSRWNALTVQFNPGITQYGQSVAVESVSPNYRLHAKN